MSIANFNIGQIRQTQPKDFAMGLIGLGKDIEHCYRDFLLQAREPDEREYPAAADQTHAPSRRFTIVQTRNLTPDFGIPQPCLTPRKSPPPW